MRFPGLLLLSSRYLFRHLRRYVFLIVALTLGFAVITVITSLQNGMTRSVYNSAQGHYAGDIVILGNDKDSNTQFRISESEKILAVVRETAESEDFGIHRIVRRTQFGKKGLLYFNGTAVRQKYVLGVDWQAEEEYFRTLSYVSGGYEELTGREDVFISAPVAEELKARIGDRIILEVNTRTGQKNTGAFIIRGIIADATIFGYYKCFIDRRALNDLLRYESGDCSTIGIYLKDRNRAEQDARLLSNNLAATVPTAHFVPTRDEHEEQVHQSWEGIRHFVLTLDVYLSEVSELLSSIRIVGYFLYVMMLLIIFVSSLVTYNLILYERSRELGTMRSLGFYAEDIQTLLILEALLLLGISLVCGFILAKLIVWGVSLLSFQQIPSFEIFMKDGRLQAVYKPVTILFNVVALMLTISVPVWFPSYRISRMGLPEALNGGDK